LICSSKECSAAVAADASVVRVVGLARWSLLAADRADAIVVHLGHVGVDEKVECGVGNHGQTLRLQKE